MGLVNCVVLQRAFRGARLYRAFSDAGSYPALEMPCSNELSKQCHIVAGIEFATSQWEFVLATSQWDFWNQPRRSGTLNQPHRSGTFGINHIIVGLLEFWAFFGFCPQAKLCWDLCGDNVILRPNFGSNMRSIYLWRV